MVNDDSTRTKVSYLATGGQDIEKQPGCSIDSGLSPQRQPWTSPRCRRIGLAATRHGQPSPYHSDLSNYHDYS